MKRQSRTINLIVMCVAVISMSCDRAPVECAETFGVLFTIKNHIPTRATAAIAEDELVEWCLYVADSRGKIVDALSELTTSALRNLPAGTYTAYAAVNCGLEEDAFTTETALKSYQCSFPGEVSGLTMFGSKAFNVPEDAHCDISVSRLVSKVEVGKICVDFSEHPDLAARQFKIDAVYLINVPGSSTLEEDLSYIPSEWYNRLGYVSNSADALLYDAVDVKVSSGSAYAVPHYFYCFQNNTESDSREPSWSVRRTRLVIECSIGTRKTFYPVDIVGPGTTLLRNHLYRISEITITGIGSDSPDAEITQQEASNFSMTVSTWD